MSLPTIVTRIADLRDQLDRLGPRHPQRDELNARIADLEEVAGRLMGDDPLATARFDGSALL